MTKAQLLAEVRALRKALARETAKVKRQAAKLEREKAALRKVEQERAAVVEQQTATGEILRVISSSPTNVEPVFNAIVERAVHLAGGSGRYSALFRLEDGHFHMVAQYGVPPETLAIFERHFPLPVERSGLMQAALAARGPVHAPDVFNDARVGPFARTLAESQGYRALMHVPLVRGGVVLGILSVTKREVEPFTDKQIALLQTFADQAVIAIENVRLFTELEEKNRQVTEALEQQMATSEILRVISSSPTDLQPVFDAIVESAARLCGARFTALYRYDGELVHVAAHHRLTPEVLAVLQRLYPMRPARDQASGRAISSGAVVHIPDVLADPEYRHEVAIAGGWGSLLAVPMMHGGRAVGTINIYRAEAESFPDGQIELLKTFADQAVIAIENVRLFTELQEKNRTVTEALEQQTATAEVLGVISSSPTDVQPVFEAITRSALKLCGATSSLVTTFDGESIHLSALANVNPQGADALRRRFPMRPGRASGAARAIATRSVVQILDTREDRELVLQDAAESAQYRSVLVVPMLREGEPIGTVNVHKAEPGPFADTQIALLKTFADQAVIAIENVRLFTALAARNREVTAALDQQTATAEILRVISRSGTDVQPVFDAIAHSAQRLLRGWGALVLRFDGELLHAAAVAGGLPGTAEVLREQFPWRPRRGAFVGDAMLDREVKQIEDIETEEVWSELRPRARVRGWRANLAVPMLQEGQPIGVITVTRVEPGRFAPQEVELLQTFADQAVIAIENARLLTELQRRTHELTRSVDQLTALGDVGRAVSSSLDLDTVLTTIVRRAVQLSGTDGGTIFEYDEAAEEFSLRATLNADETATAPLRATRLRRGEGAVGQMAVTREPIQIPDITVEGAYDSRLRGALLESGTRALLAVPLLHENRIVGGLVVSRREPGEFGPDVVDLLRTFATQSALAIQNARLFREIEVKSRQLEVASQHKSEFLANMSHELRTPLNGIIGFSEVMLERMFGDVNEKQEEYLRDILSSGRHLLSLINDILDLSKIEAGRMELELSDFDLPSAVDNAMILMRERAGGRGIALERVVDERLGAVRADERKVKQVLLNLLSNAVKFTSEGGRIEVRAALRDGVAEISVADTGTGIAPEDHEAIFEEFRQVGSADKKAEGTGLGLALCRKFVELHGGRIWIKSQLREGSTFTFTLPVRPIAS